jgi:hypothetical protein
LQLRHQVVLLLDSQSISANLATFAACRNQFVLVLGLQGQDTIICTSQPGSTDVIMRANKQRGRRRQPLSSGAAQREVVAAGAGAFRAASQVLKYSAKLPEISRVYFELHDRIVQSHKPFKSKWAWYLFICISKVTLKGERATKINFFFFKLYCKRVN